MVTAIVVDDLSVDDDAAWKHHDGRPLRVSHRTWYGDGWRERVGRAWNDFVNGRKVDFTLEGDQSVFERDSLCARSSCRFAQFRRVIEAKHACKFKIRSVRQNVVHRLAVWGETAIEGQGDSRFAIRE